MTRRTFVRLVPMAAVAAVAGCGYSLAGRGSFLPAHIRTIGVPLFVNQTSVPDVERRITEAIRSELIGRGRYKVETGAEGVDGVLAGEIISITLSPDAVNEQRQATRYTILLTAKVEFRDVKDGKVIWSNPSMQFREPYEFSGTVSDPNAFFGQEVDALNKMATEFARTLVSAILEAF